LAISRSSKAIQIHIEKKRQTSSSQRHRRPAKSAISAIAAVAAIEGEGVAAHLIARGKFADDFLGGGVAPVDLRHAQFVESG